MKKCFVFTWYECFTMICLTSLCTNDLYTTLKLTLVSILYAFTSFRYQGRITSVIRTDITPNRKRNGSTLNWQKMSSAQHYAFSKSDNADGACRSRGRLMRSPVVWLDLTGLRLHSYAYLLENVWLVPQYFLIIIAVHYTELVLSTSS